VNTEVMTVDVREDLRLGREPFARIMAAVDALPPGGSLRVIAPIKPLPLLGVMARRGFSHEAMEGPTGDWDVLFRPDAAVGAPLPGTGTIRPSCPAMPEERDREIDARGLEPPLPMVRVLEAVADLPARVTLIARTDRRPVHLYAQLEARGLSGVSEAQPDGSFITRIRHA
jgi:uncharacterized protein (DUF2249 family)